MSVWLGKKLADIIEKPPDVKINPNGVDLKISEIWSLSEDSVITINGKDRRIEPDKVKIEPREDDFYYLPKGTYEIRVANKISIPKNAVGFLFPRSTFNRLGIMKSETALWDSGYSGWGTQTVRVTVKEARIHKDEFWFQFVVIDMKEEVDHVYDGHWQGEGMKK